MSSKNIARSAFWITIAEIVFNLSGYIVHSVTGRLLGPADYGRYSLIITLTTTMIIFLGRGIPTAMSKYLSQFFETNPGAVPYIKKQAAILQLCIISIVTAIFYFSIPLITNLLNDDSLIPLFKISTLIIPAWAASAFYIYYYAGLHKFNIQAGLKIVRSLARITFIILLAYLFKVEGAITGYILTPFFVFIIAFSIDQLFVAKQFRKNTVSKLKEFNWKTLLNYAWPFTLFMLFYEVFISLNLYFVKALLQDDNLTGIFNAVLTIGRIPYYMFYALTIILLPTISKLESQKDMDRIKETVSKSLHLMILFLIPSIFLLSLYSKESIDFLYGQEYIQGAKTLSIVVLAVSFSTVFYILSYTINGIGKVKLPMYVGFAGVVLNSILNYFFIQAYGITGSAIALTISAFFIMSTLLYFVYKYFQISIKVISLIKTLIAGIIIYILGRFLPSSTAIFIPISAILGIIYFLLLYYLKVLTNDDINLFKRMIFKKKKKEA